MSQYDIVIIGSGVIGLSTARELDNRGYRVAIVAKDLPEDATSTGFASPWAGCNWFSFAQGGTPAANWDTITYKQFGKLAEEHPELCEKIPFCSVWDTPKGKEGTPWFHKLVSDYKDLKATSTAPLPGKKAYGHSFTSYVLNAPAYLAHLGADVRSRHIPIIRARLSSLDEAYSLPSIGPVQLVVNATGMGAKSLIGVEDDKVYPARGQTVLVKAPGFKECLIQPEPIPPAYIIPRPGPEGQVILGGVYQPNVWDTLPSLTEAERILKDCYDLAPALAGPNGKSWKDIEIVAHNVGLRPAREGDPRLELEEREIGQGASRKGAYAIAPAVGKLGHKRKVAVVHAYGIGSAGFQASLGMAANVSDLAIEYLTRNPRAKL
ncbi:D-amino-acid oxidase [Cryptococcus wingfieldii CBS 7118]|uniref:D-amino-acid oxidase n=1 Tax=Cryptococcus wingfieldii CBS 7118 TaxID=1295528 RepID=A0A1E3IU59_9TREE|nr:D-amino-acid oxidase [Cryptococcus wingfieldii CBS 7118]ODN92140.1 D-amino-acid oxidase [Cryptococcus wingfieldii CBS 7118]